MSTAIFIEDSFDSAHFLPNVPHGHKCSRMHGHTYRIRIEIVGKIDEKSGWIMDYAALKTVWHEIKEQLDHKTLNDVIPNPTCELIAGWIALKLGEAGDCFFPDRIELRETEHCGVVWDQF